MMRNPTINNNTQSAIHLRRVLSSSRACVSSLRNLYLVIISNKLLRVNIYCSLVHSFISGRSGKRRSKVGMNTSKKGGKRIQTCISSCMFCLCFVRPAQASQLCFPAREPQHRPLPAQHAQEQQTQHQCRREQHEQQRGGVGRARLG